MNTEDPADLRAQVDSLSRKIKRLEHELQVSRTDSQYFVDKLKSAEYAIERMESAARLYRSDYKKGK